MDYTQEVSVANPVTSVPKVGGEAEPAEKAEPVISTPSLPRIPDQSVATAQTEKVTSSKPCLLYTSPSPRDRTRSRMPSSA